MLTHSDGEPRLSSRALAQLYYLQASPWILGIFFQRYYHQVYQLCLSYLKHPGEAEDATMEIFEYLSQHLQDYQVNNFTAWLMTLSRHHSLHRKHQLTKRKEGVIYLQQHPCLDHQALELKLIQERKLERLSYQINQLKSIQRQCLISFYLNQQSYKEIALQLDISLKAVKSHIQNGKRNLRKSLLE